MAERSAVIRVAGPAHRTSTADRRSPLSAPRGVLDTMTNTDAQPDRAKEFLPQELTDLRALICFVHEHLAAPPREEWQTGLTIRLDWADEPFIGELELHETHRLAAQVLRAPSALPLKAG